MHSVENLYFNSTEDLDLGNTPQEVDQLKHCHTKYFIHCHFVIFYV